MLLNLSKACNLLYCTFGGGDTSKYERKSIPTNRSRLKEMKLNEIKMNVFMFFLVSYFVNIMHFYFVVGSRLSKYNILLSL